MNSAVEYIQFYLLRMSPAIQVNSSNNKFYSFKKGSISLKQFSERYDGKIATTIYDNGHSQSILRLILCMKKFSKLFLLLILVALFSSGKKQVPEVIYLTDWKFKTGDNPDWANPDFKDSNWKSQVSGIPVEYDGKTDSEGYTWYRKNFDLPVEMLHQAFFKDSIVLQLGKGDKIGEMFLNGHSFIKNGVLVNENDNARFIVDHATR